MDAEATRQAVAHLLRRAAFGGHADEIDALAAKGYAAAVDAVCDFSSADAAADAIAPPEFDTAGYLAARATADESARQTARQRAAEERRALVLWWLQRMVQADHPHREKSALLWHDHFATSIQKVKVAELMHRQRAAFYDLGHVHFDELLTTMVSDPAMLIWLDGRESTVKAPNENFAREFFELFTLGHVAGHHAVPDDHSRTAHDDGPPYTERDVAEAARAFTGWRFGRTEAGPVLDPRRHDAGTKTVLGRTGQLGGEDVVALATAHPACAPHVVARLWSRVARPAGPDDEVVVELAESFAADLDLGALRRRMFEHADFLAASTRTALLKTPVELVVGSARALRVSLDRRYLRVLAALGQLPFSPPDVAGWPANEGWLSTSSALTRVHLGHTMAAEADLSTVEGLAAARRPEALARLLGVAEWSRTTRAALLAADEPIASLTVALAAPEHLLA
ncbi:MAG: DUF1800 domain-containing protein [Ilumatobacteraceae bacterium]